MISSVLCVTSGVVLGLFGKDVHNAMKRYKRDKKYKTIALNMVDGLLLSPKDEAKEEKA